jgi:hypothetical protein
MTQETLEEVALRRYQYTSVNPPYTIITPKDKVQGFIEGAKWQAERMYSEEDMKQFADFVATYPDKNRNAHGEMLHAKSKYDGAERTLDLLKEWSEQFKKK